MSSLGTYDEATGKLINDTDELACTDANDYCTTIAWTSSSWAGGNIPGLRTQAPQKDTIVVPTG